jgi:transcriptional antiterminator RfaH
MNLLLDEARWFAVQTKPRQETVAEYILQKVGIETFFPKISGNKALFTSYIFAKFPVATHLRRVKYAQGVKAVVGFGLEPAPLDETFIETIQLRIKNGLVVMESPCFSRGERVRITEGPLEGIEGVFDSRLKDSDRVVILLTALAGQGRLVLSSRFLRKVS